MLTIDSLKAFGANTDEGVARCFGKEDFYLRLAKMVVAQNQADFDKLSAAIGANDLGAAFDAAHSLKGVLGNLSLTPIYDPVSEITEELRAKWTRTTARSWPPSSPSSTSSRRCVQTEAKIKRRTLPRKRPSFYLTQRLEIHAHRAAAGEAVLRRRVGGHVHLDDGAAAAR